METESIIDELCKLQPNEMLVFRRHDDSLVTEMRRAVGNNVLNTRRVDGIDTIQQLKIDALAFFLQSIREQMDATPLPADDATAVTRKSSAAPPLPAGRAPSPPSQCESP